MTGAADATPYRLAQVLQPNEPLAGDHFGTALGFDGDLIAIKSQSPYAIGDDLSVTHLFEPTRSGRWEETFTYRFDPPGNNPGNPFIGEELAVDNGTVAIGYGPSFKPGIVDPLRFLTRDGDSWRVNIGRLEIRTPEDRIPDFAWPGDAIAGRSVDISGDFVIVDDPAAERLEGGLGTARVLQRSGNGDWDEVANLDLGGSDSFAPFTVAIDGTTALAGPRNLGRSDASAGAYFFERELSGEWRLTEQFPLDRAVGVFVAIDGDTAAAYSSASPSVQTFRRTEGVWVETPAPDLDLEPFTNFGIAVEDGVLALGFDDRVEVYGINAAGEWTLDATLTDPDPDAGRQFGWKVALSEGRVLVGAPTDPLNPGTAPGAAYLFVPAPEPTTVALLLLATVANATRRHRS